MNPALQEPPSRPVPKAFRILTWDDLEKWTDSGSIRRGRGYVGHVSDEGITEDGRIVATVSGREDYATELRFDETGELQGRCTCPVGHRCKHTVALALKCIDLLGAGKELPILEEDDERLEELREDGEWEDDEEEEPESDDENEAGGESDHAGDSWDGPPPVRSPAARAKPGDELDEHLDALGESDAKALLREIIARNPGIRTDLLRRIRTDRGDVPQLLKMARKELRRLSREDAYVNPWKHEYHVPDYTPLRAILLKLRDRKAFDELVAFGDELKKETAMQIECANDEGDTAGQICSCMEVVAKAVRNSSLSDSERIRWFCAIHENDDCCAYDGIYDPFENPSDWDESVWSDYANELHAAFDARRRPDDGNEEESKYEQERRLRHVCEALRNAGRGDEARSLRINWLKKRGDYEALAQFFMDEGDLDAAWKSAAEGISNRSLHDPYGHAKESLRHFLRDLAKKRGDARLALSIMAEDFFARPSSEGFLDLVKAAKEEKIDADMRPWLVRFLETGRLPDDSRAEPAKSAPTRKRGRPPKVRPEVNPARRAASARDSVPSVPWPLSPSGFPKSERYPGGTSGSAVLLEIALEEKKPDDVLSRWKAFCASSGTTGFNRWDGNGFLAERVADALVEAHPEEALRIWDKLVDGDLGITAQHAYDAISGRFRKARPVMERLGRLGEWEGRIRALMDEYKRRPNFVKALSALVDSPPPSMSILQTRRR